MTSTTPVEVFIECGTAPNAYQVALTGKDLDVFHKAAQAKEVQGKTGEELVSAIIKAANGGILKVERKDKNGKYNDGANGEPCLEKFEQGKSVLICHGKDGQYNDGPNGEPAMTRFYIGHLELIERYKDGKRQDGPNGEPAVQKFNIFHDGQLKKIERYTDDKLNDSANGEPAVVETGGYHGEVTLVEHWKDGKRNDSASGKPAVQKFDREGALESIEHWKDDTLVQKQDGKEIRYVLEQPEIAKKIKSITAANPAIKVRQTY